MTGRRLAWILGIAALMLAALLLLGDDSGDGSHGETLDLGARIGPNVSYIRIDRPDGDVLELNRRDEGWTVNGFPALDSLASATAAGLDTLPPGRLISRSPTNHERMGLTGDAAVRVRVGPAGAPMADFLVGGSGVDGRFVRLPEEERSYVFSARVMNPLAGDESEWRDYMIAEVDTAALHRIVIRRQGRAGAELVRSGSTPSGWAVDGAPADSAVMQAYLRVLAGLESTGFPADSFVYAADFENPMAEVRLYLEDAAPGAGSVPDISLLFSDSPGHPDALVRRADDPIVYAIDRRRANALTSPAGSFRSR